MPKYQVFLDKGVKIGGKWYRHGEIVDGDTIGKPEPMPPIVANATEEQKAEYAAETEKRKKEAEEAAKDAKLDLELAIKSGALAPPEPVKNEKKKEG